ncbi:MAG: TIGR01777 family protein [Candidatus Omnitrophica bacterium]|nr:TIGR01777 family protein [Candidatus Omnitrophota bacterium]
MKVLITGGTGFLGSRLCERLVRAGHDLCVLTRNPLARIGQAGVQFLSWDGQEWEHALAEAQAVINLAGEPIAEGRWTAAQKARIRESRVHATRQLVGRMASRLEKPAVLINASAIGYYGPCGEEEVTEADPPGHGFLAETCRAWEAEAQRAEDLGVRVVRLRLGVVLGPSGGALAKMVPPFVLFLGGPIGSGRQWVSWIHREDVVGMIEWALSHPQVSGAVNVTAPHPVTMREFCETLGRVLGRPSWLPVPAWALRLWLGEMAQVLVTGQRVIPHAATRGQYAFIYPDLQAALEAALASYSARVLPDDSQATQSRG